MVSLSSIKKLLIVLKSGKISKNVLGLGIAIFCLILVLIFIALIPSVQPAVQNVTKQSSQSIQPSRPVFTPTIFTFENLGNIDVEKQILENDINQIVFNSSAFEYNIKIKRDTKVLFINDLGVTIGITFSDGRSLRLQPQEKAVEEFNKPGVITFTEVSTDTLMPLKGSITVI